MTEKHRLFKISVTVVIKYIAKIDGDQLYYIIRYYKSIN